MNRSQDPRIEGIRLVRLEPHHDRRGWLFEAYRDSWMTGVEELQVNVIWSRANVLRGSHVHARHVDWFVMASGEALAGLKDVRADSPTCGVTSFVLINAESPTALVVPPGVVHALYFQNNSILVTMESCTYDPEEEFRCRWNDPELEIEWPFTDPILSDNDREAPSYADMLRRYERARAGAVSR